MNTILITAPECSKCNYVKSHVDCTGIKVLDRSDSEAMAYMTYFGIYDDALIHLPVLIVDADDDETQILHGNGIKIVKKIKEIMTEQK